MLNDLSQVRQVTSNWTSSLERLKYPKKPTRKPRLEAVYAIYRKINRKRLSWIKKFSYLMTTWKQPGGNWYFHVLERNVSLTNFTVVLLNLCTLSHHNYPPKKEESNYFGINWSQISKNGTCTADRRIVFVVYYTRATRKRPSTDILIPVLQTANDYKYILVVTY